MESFLTFVLVIGGWVALQIVLSKLGIPT